MPRFHLIDRICLFDRLPRSLLLSFPADLLISVFCLSFLSCLQVAADSRVVGLTALQSLLRVVRLDSARTGLLAETGRAIKRHWTISNASLGPHYLHHTEVPQLVYISISHILVVHISSSNALCGPPSREDRLPPLSLSLRFFDHTIYAMLVTIVSSACSSTCICLCWYIRTSYCSLVCPSGYLSVFMHGCTFAYRCVKGHDDGRCCICSQAHINAYAFNPVDSAHSILMAPFLTHHSNSLLASLRDAACSVPLLSETLSALCLSTWSASCLKMPISAHTAPVWISLPSCTLLQVTHTLSLNLLLCLGILPHDRHVHTLT